MTEEEAKTKRCPSVHRDPRDKPLPAHPNECCLGSACMAWRWLPKATGYCGLAGAPDWSAPEVELPR